MSETGPGGPPPEDQGINPDNIVANAAETAKQFVDTPDSTSTTQRYQTGIQISRPFTPNLPTTTTISSTPELGEPKPPGGGDI